MTRRAPQSPRAHGRGEFRRTKRAGGAYSAHGGDWQRCAIRCWQAFSASSSPAGQIYNGQIIAGILWLVLTPGFWIGTGGTLGWVCHILAAYFAYTYAKQHRVRV